MRGSLTGQGARAGTRTGHISTVDDRLRTLESDNRLLQARLGELTDQVTRNDSLLRKTQERELDLLRASSLPRLLERICYGLNASYQLEAVNLLLRDPQHEIRHLLSAEEQQDVRFVDALNSLAPHLESLDRPWLGPYHAADHGQLVYGSRGAGSVALIPLLRNEQLDGVLVFSSSDPFRFTSELATDFLAHLGVVAAICLENAINRARLLRSGFTDFLTGFHNRRYLNARLREELSRAQRVHQSIACLMIDVDHFKHINDRYGHPAGDAVLREVAHRIDTEMRTSDTGARFGGDEFAIVLPHGGVVDGEKVALRVLDAVRSRPIVISSEASETITLSIGVAVAEPPQGSRDCKVLADRLIAEADTALYRAKSAGRNRVESSQNVIA
jgi:two-component system, cell cycle response regulator